MTAADVAIVNNLIKLNLIRDGESVGPHKLKTLLGCSHGEQGACKKCMSAVSQVRVTIKLGRA